MADMKWRCIAVLVSSFCFSIGGAETLRVDPSLWRPRNAAEWVVQAAALSDGVLIGTVGNVEAAAGLVHDPRNCFRLVDVIVVRAIVEAAAEVRVCAWFPSPWAAAEAGFSVWPPEPGSDVMLFGRTEATGTWIPTLGRGLLPADDDSAYVSEVDTTIGIGEVELWLGLGEVVGVNVRGTSETAIVRSADAIVAAADEDQGAGATSANDGPESPPQEDEDTVSSRDAGLR